MHDTFVGLTLYGNFIIIFLLFGLIYRYRKLICFQQGINISIIVGGMAALNTGVLLIFQFPFQFTLITIFATLVGMGVGGVFGAIFDYQTFLTGFINGLTLGLMAPMIGSILNNQVLFIIVIEILLLFTTGLIIRSIRKT